MNSLGSVRPQKSRFVTTLLLINNCFIIHVFIYIISSIASIINVHERIGGGGGGGGSSRIFRV